MPSRARSQLPDEPGVYRMLRGGADVLYVGKATSLRQRVRSYFAPGASHAEHTLEMLSQARDIDFTVTSSALEAALLEVEEIHRLRPPYNRALRPDERTLVFATARLDSFRETADAKHRVGPLPATEIWTEWAEAAQGLAAPLAIGMRLWRADEAGEVEFQLKAKVPTIEQRRDDILRRASHLVRRAHWFRLTQGATVSWGRRQVSTPDGPWDVVAYDRLVVLTSELRRLVREGQRPVLQTRRARLDAETVERLLRWV